jgi:hypothetical protein
MADCPTCEYHKQRAQIWRDEAYKLSGHPLPRKETSMTHEEQIAKLTEMLEIQQKLHETAIDMLKPAIEAEREACAKVCDDFPDVGYVDNKLTSDYHSYLIRKRGQA